MVPAEIMSLVFRESPDYFHQNVNKTVSAHFIRTNKRIWNNDTQELIKTLQLSANWAQIEFLSNKGIIGSKWFLKN